MLEPALLRGCVRCGLVQRVERLLPRAACARCGAVVWDPDHDRARLRWAGAFALAALLVYPLAISLPIMEIERLGNRVRASIWGGSLGMLRHGEVAVGLVVFCCSVVLPLGKLVALSTLIFGRGRIPRAARAPTWRLIEWTGRFGMLDVLLVALIVAWVKLGDLAVVRAGPAALAFAVCVLASLIASALFDPHALWEDDPTHAERR